MANFDASLNNDETGSKRLMASDGSDVSRPILLTCSGLRSYLRGLCCLFCATCQKLRLGPRRALLFGERSRCRSPFVETEMENIGYEEVRLQCASAHARFDCAAKRSVSRN